MKKIVRGLVHSLTGARSWQFRKVEKFANNKINLQILELGSGKKVNGKYIYSAKHLFNSKNSFLQTDIVKDYGHTIVDVTKMNEKNKYDLVLCLNVLEHVYEYDLAIKNIHESMKDGATLLIALPMYYPLHDEPADYWRFTEHSIRKMLSMFNNIRIEHKGLRQFPYCYFIEVTK